MKTMIWTAVVAAMAAGCWEGNGETQGKSSQYPPEPFVKAAMASKDGSGQQIASWCGGCHGDGGISQSQYIPHLAGQRLEYLVGELKAYREGARDNPAMHAVVKSISDEEAWNVATFFATHGNNESALSEPNPGTWPIILVTPATGKWVPKCNRCHDDNGFADHGRYPILTGQRKEYLTDSMHAYQSKFLRDSSTMHAMTELLSARDIDDIATYYALRPGEERVGRPATEQAKSGGRSSD